MNPELGAGPTVLIAIDYVITDPTVQKVTVQPPDQKISTGLS